MTRIISAGVAAAILLTNTGEAQAPEPVSLIITEFETGVPSPQVLGRVHLGKETLTNNTHVEIQWGDKTTVANLILSSEDTYINDKNFKLTKAGDYKYAEPLHFYSKPGTYSVTATLVATFAGTNDPPSRYPIVKTVNARDRRPVNEIQIVPRTISPGRTITIHTVLNANIPAGTTVNYSVKKGATPARGILGAPFSGDSAAIQIPSQAVVADLPVPVLAGAARGTYTVTATTTGQSRSANFSIP